MAEKTTEGRLTDLEIGQAELTLRFKHISEKLDKIANNEQKHVTLLIKVVAIIAVGERVLSVLGDRIIPLLGG